MKLVIVESPTKAKTIAKFLGKGFTVESSFGHIRDLPKSEIGVDTEKGFAPRYVVPTKARKTVTKLKKLADKAEQIILASDEDREGEAIAWHLAEALKLPEEKISRIVFHEITKEAIEEALAGPRSLDVNLVDAQQARRILDRLVGYELSPFLWKKVARGLSAGRVQSVAVRLIVEREKEIRAFKTDEYWTISAELTTSGKEILKAELFSLDKKTLDKFAFKNEEETLKLVKELEKEAYQVSSVEKKRGQKNPPSPFTTSSLQQTANRFLGFSAKQTMMIAQQLYEGLELGSEGSVGLITYMRTDSLHLSEKFLNEAKDYLQRTLGDKYLSASPRRFKTKAKGAQEAHEAVRPTEAGRSPDEIKEFLNPNQLKLYRLIWQRAVASQMAPAELDQVTIEVKAGRGDFRANGQTIAFPGYLAIYPEKSKELLLPTVKENEKLSLNDLLPEQHFTKPPARYSDATLVKELEKNGIGRPSTYAPTIATIEARNYVERDDQKRLKPTAIAEVVNDVLTAHFPNIVDLQFTANLENDFDEIAAGKIGWQGVLESFYGPFHENLQNKYEEVKKDEIMPEQPTEEICEKCGSQMIIKTGRYGPFLACGNFPECKNIKSLDKDKPEEDEKIKALKEKHQEDKCEKCGEAMVVKTGRFGPFLGCSNYPKCKNIKNLETEEGPKVVCPICKEGQIVTKRSRRGIFYACNRYPDCKTAYNNKPTGENCPECGDLLLDNPKGIKCGSKSCSYIKEA